MHLLGQVGQPRRHVLETEMFVLDTGLAEALDALVEELQRQMRLVLRQFLTHRLDEDGVV